MTSLAEQKLAAARRQILHVDMDAFFAAVEQLDNPALRGKPLLVGGDPNGRGVVSTASYEARPFGCRSAMPMRQAMRLCPQAIIVRPRMHRYVEVSEQVFEIFDQFSPCVEGLSLDEAFLDLTGSERLLGPAPEAAAELKSRVRERTGLTASVGVAPTKFLAKLASDLQKPDGLVVVPPDRIDTFLDPLPISKLWGAGRVAQDRFARIGVRTFADARQLTRVQLVAEFGSQGEHFYELLRGIDDRPVVSDRDAKSVGREETFAADIDHADTLRETLLGQVEHVAARLRRADLTTRGVMLKIRDADFETITRQMTLAAATDRTDLLWTAVAELFDEWRRGGVYPVRLIGVAANHLTHSSGEQLGLFDAGEAQRRKRLDRTVDQIRDRFGGSAIHRGTPDRRSGP
jgi:DNA polymerase-4